MANLTRSRLLPPAALALLVAAGLSLPLAAQVPEKAPPSAAKGRELAARLCKNCHVVEGEAAASVPAGLPSMRGIANATGQTGQRIHDVLIRPTHPMPDMQLSIDEILDIIMYLETLRTNPAVPPLITPGGPDGNPKLPSRS